MAFKKQEKFIFEDTTINANNSDVLSIPLVIMHTNNVYQGFVPGFVMKDVVDSNLDSCKQKLLVYVKQIIKTKITNNQSFPFFPTNEQVKQDYKNVILIKRINVKIK